jgi:hypothetical protein
MLCALTVRKLTPGALEDFQKAFIPAAAPPGWTRFYALRNVDDEDEVITFGFFDGTPEELRASHQQDAGDYEDRRRAADELVKCRWRERRLRGARGALIHPGPDLRIRVTGCCIAQTRGEHERRPASPTALRPAPRQSRRSPRRQRVRNRTRPVTSRAFHPC